MKFDTNESTRGKSAVVSLLATRMKARARGGGGGERAW